jgi:hypothetical protein
MPTRRVVTVLLLVGTFLLVYLPAIGHGFIKDDFMWIARGREARSLAGAAKLVQ